MRSLIFQLLVVIPTKCNDGEADHCARGGTCFSLAVPVAQANSRSLDCEDRPLCGRSSSLGMTELFSFQIAAWLEAVPFQRPHVVLLTISITRISPDASFVTSNGTMVFIKTVLKKNAIYNPSGNCAPKRPCASDSSSATCSLPCVPLRITLIDTPGIGARQIGRKPSH